VLGDGTIVICVDNFFTRARRNIEHLLDRKRFEVIRHDVTFPLYDEVDEICVAAEDKATSNAGHPASLKTMAPGRHTIRGGDHAS
jgi:hypothetical protein